MILVPTIRSSYNPDMGNVKIGEFSVERMFRAVELVDERLHRAVRALEAGEIPYAVVGDMAVGDWIARVDESAVRYTPRVEFLIAPKDVDAAAAALEASGFVHRHGPGVEMFLDSPDARDREAVQVIVPTNGNKSECAYAVEDISSAARSANFRVVALEPLVRASLAAFRINDKVNLRDLLDAGLIDETSLAKLPTDLAARLKELIDTPDG